MIFLRILERRLCQRVHSAVCTRPAANRTRLTGHEKPPFLDPDVELNVKHRLTYVYIGNF